MAAARSAVVNCGQTNGVSPPPERPAMVMLSCPRVPTVGCAAKARAALAGVTPTSQSAAVVEPEDGMIGIGSGGNYALAAARALMPLDFTAEEIVRRSMKIAADICVYTNGNLTVERITAQA